MLYVRHEFTNKYEKCKGFYNFSSHTCNKNEFGTNWVEEEALNVLLYPSEGSTSLCDARTLPE